MSCDKEEKQYANGHYMYYPKEKVPIYLAFAFRPMFLLLAPYIVISIILWGLTFSGIINISFIDDLLSWHMYEMIYGIGMAGLIGFFLTGAPEMYPGVIPIIGRKLANIILLWVLGRISFWFIDYLGVYIVAIINVSLIFWIIMLVIKPLVMDPNRKNISFAYILTIILAIQVWFFMSAANLVETSKYSILLLALASFTVLELLALKRINMEAINEFLEQQGIDETFYSNSARYNLAIFCIIVFSIVEFLYPSNEILGWLGLASAAAILGLVNDFFLKDNNILSKPFILYMITIVVLMSLGYGLMGYDYLNSELNAINHFRHFLTTGVFGLVFFMVMVIVSTIHTGRKIFTNKWISFSVFLIVISTFIRSFIPLYENYSIEAYISSSILWAIPFIIYMKIFFPFLLNKRADGIPG